MDYSYGSVLSTGVFCYIKGSVGMLKHVYERRDRPKKHESYKQIYLAVAAGFQTGGKRLIFVDKKCSS